MGSKSACASFRRPFSVCHVESQQRAADQKTLGPKNFGGGKKWEIRSSATSKRGVVALAVSGTGKLFGSVSISDCILVGERTSDGRLVQGKAKEEHFIGNATNAAKHCIDDLNLVKYAKIFAWVLTDPVVYCPRRPFFHKRGCVTWVNLTDAEPQSSKSKSPVSKQPPMSKSSILKRPSVKKTKAKK